MPLIHPVWGSLWVAGVGAWLVASVLGVYATALRDRHAEAYWFAALVGIATACAAELSGAFVSREAIDGLDLFALPGAVGTLGWLPMAVAAVAMWIVSRRRLAATAPAGSPAVAFPRWEAAAWGYFLPYAAQLGIVVAVGLAGGLAWLAGSQWLFDLCVSPVDQRAVCWEPVIDAARRVTAWWWLGGLVAGPLLGLVLLVWLVLRAAPRGARWRLVGFTVLVWLVETAVTEWDELDPFIALVYGTLPFALAAFVAFRPLRTPAPSTAPSAPPPA